MTSKTIDSEWKYLCHLEDSDETELEQVDIDHILQLLRTENLDVRNFAVQIAGLYYCPSFEQSLVELLKDRESIVRVNACDSLSNSDNASVREKIIPLMPARQRLERGYALISYSDITLNSGQPKEPAIEVLRQYFEKERNTWVRVLGIEALAQLGDKQALPELYRHTSDTYYNTRRVAIGCAHEFLADLDHGQLLFVLQAQRTKEEDPSIKDEIDNLIGEIGNNKQQTN